MQAQAILAPARSPRREYATQERRFGRARLFRDVCVSILSDAAFSFSIIDPFSLIAHDHPTHYPTHSPHQVTPTRRHTSSPTSPVTSK